MTRPTRDFRTFLRELSPHEAPVLIAVREMVVSAQEGGSFSARHLVEPFRDSYLARHEKAADDGVSENRRLREIRQMTADEVSSYLEEQVLSRLSAEGWIEGLPGHDQDVVHFTGPVWAEIRADQAGLTALIDEEIDKRLTEPAEGEPIPQEAGASELTARAVVKTYKRRRVVDDVDIELRQGEIVGLLGPNGAGKTTTFYMIVGLVPPDSGRVFIDSEDLTHVPMFKRARRGIGYLSQEPSVFRKLTVEQNIMAILETLPLSHDERRERLEQLLDELSIKHLRKNKAYSLSGGERRRLEITRALVTSPKFMLLDEPFAGVDPIAVDDIQRIVAGLRQRGLGVLITDHNVRETLSITDRAYIMFDGKIHVGGTSEELVNDPQARRLYLGEDFQL